VAGRPGWSRLRSDDPAAGMVFGIDFIVEETVTWVGRHIVTHVRKAF
jgi:hypothetical protein